MIEVWKQVPGYPYMVSNMGSVVSFARKNKREIKPILQEDGYSHVTFCREGKTKQIALHRIVATLFCDNQSGKPFVNHKNGNRSDNRAENLEWVTAKENSQHAKNVLGFDFTTANGRCKTVVRSDGRTFNSISEASRETGCNRANIQLVLRDKRTKCGGYGWEWKNA